jgi:hypothetical protein
MAPASKSPEKKTLVVAKDGFICSVKGVEYLIKQGEVLESTHPAVDKHGELFEPAKQAAA